MFKAQIERDCILLQNSIDEINKQLAELPEGKFIYTRNRNKFKWYNRLGKKLIYIKQSEPHIAAPLAYKKILTVKLAGLMCELRGLERILPQYEKTEKLLAKYLCEDSPIPALLSYRDADDPIKEWLQKDFISNPYRPEDLIHQTINKHRVRSKSEAMIVTELVERNIPYRYECQLKLDGQTFYPDFTILHPITLKEIYWEHCGLMDDKLYATDAMKKIRTYAEHDIFPPQNLVLTFESKKNPLSINVIRRTIDNILEMY